MTMADKILLISPNAEMLDDKLAYPPLGLLYLAANLDRKLWKPKVKIMTDNKFTDYDYKYYGISVHSIAVVDTVRKLVSDIKSHNNHAQIFLGGAGAGLLDDQRNVLTYIGEVEKYLNIDTSNLDNIKFPARELLPKKYIKYTGTVHHSTKPSTTMIATRGCVYNCAFCDRETFGRRFRKRSIKNVCKEVKLLVDKYGIEHIRFCDDCVTLDRKWFMELCSNIAKYDITWTCMSRADLLDTEMLEYMKLAGCEEIFFGFESGSQKILKAMNKKETVQQYHDVIQKCRDAGIKSCAYIMFGFPGETEKTVEQTIRFLETAKPDKSRLSEFVPFPGCDVWNNPSKYNVEIKNDKGYWYYDNDELSLRYKYISDDTMLSLRSRMRMYYLANYKQGWANA